MSRFKKYLIMEMSIAHAATFAAKKHQGQYRKSSGAPYIVHPRGVFKILKDIKIKDNQVLISAYLHDTIEDTKTSYNEIKNEFSKEVADMVKQLTNDKKEILKVGKPEYLLNKMIKMSDGSLIIKLADRLQNVSDIMLSSHKFAEKMWSQTYYILKRLKTERVLTQNHKKIIRRIFKILEKYKSLELKK